MAEMFRARARVRLKGTESGSSLGFRRVSLKGVMAAWTGLVKWVSN